MARLRYSPGPIPNDCPPELKSYLANELRRVSGALNATVHVDVIGAEPSRAQDGDIVYADGTAWNPGSGEGFYGRENGAWVKL